MPLDPPLVHGYPKIHPPWPSPQGGPRPPGLSTLGVLSWLTVAGVAEEPFPGEDEEKRVVHLFFHFFRADRGRRPPRVGLAGLRRTAA